MEVENKVSVTMTGLPNCYEWTASEESLIFLLYCRGSDGKLGPTCLNPGTVPMGSPLVLVQVMLGRGTPRAWQMILVPVVLLKST